MRHVKISQSPPHLGGQIWKETPKRDMRGSALNGHLDEAETPVIKKNLLLFSQRHVVAIFAILAGNTNELQPPAGILSPFYNALILKPNAFSKRVPLGFRTELPDHSRAQCEISVVLKSELLQSPDLTSSKKRVRKKEKQRLRQEKHASQDFSTYLVG